MKSATLLGVLIFIGVLIWAVFQLIGIVDRELEQLSLGVSYQLAMTREALVSEVRATRLDLNTQIRDTRRELAGQFEETRGLANRQLEVANRQLDQAAQSVSATAADVHAFQLDAHAIVDRWQRRRNNRKRSRIYPSARVPPWRSSRCHQNGCWHTVLNLPPA